MASLILSPEAAADLEEIVEYIASENVDAAIRVLAEIREAMERLTDAPEIGHSREDLTSEPLRFWPVRPGIPLTLFLTKLADYGVSTFNLTKEELQRDFESA